MVYDAFKTYDASWRDDCISKPFKCVLRNCWEDYVAGILTNLSEEEQNSEKFKLPSPSRHAIVN